MHTYLSPQERGRGLNCFSTTGKDTTKKKKWQEPQALRTFFDEYAKERGFDPLNPKNWRSFNLSEMLNKKVCVTCVIGEGACLIILQMKGGYNVQFANQGFKRALEGAYPEVRFAW